MVQLTSLPSSELIGYGWLRCIDSTNLPFIACIERLMLIKTTSTHIEVTPLGLNIGDSHVQLSGLVLTISEVSWKGDPYGLVGLGIVFDFLSSSLLETWRPTAW